MEISIYFTVYTEFLSTYIYRWLFILNFCIIYVLQFQEVKTEFVALPAHLPCCLYSAVHKNKVTAIHRKNDTRLRRVTVLRGKAPQRRLSTSTRRVLIYTNCCNRRRQWEAEGREIKRERDRAHNLCETDKRLRVAINFARARGGVKTHTDTHEMQLQLIVMAMSKTESDIN